jgi:cytochrome c-type biogenesis protein CcmH/NrfG
MFREAADNLEKSLKLRPGSQAELRKLTNYRILAEEPAKALEVIEKLINEDPQSSQNYLLLGDALSAQSDIEGALKAYEESSRLDTSSAAACVAAGNLCLTRGAYDKAEEEFRKALSRDPQNTQIMHSLGNSLYHAGKYKEALKIFEKIISLDPADSSARAIIDELSTTGK